MSYFNSQLGKRKPDNDDDSDQPKPKPPQKKAARPEQSGLFNSQLGQRPSQPSPVDSVQGEAETAPPTDRLASSPQPCPLCQGVLALSEDGLWHCQGRCQTRWLASEGRLLDLAGLAYGICVCCQPPQALVAGDNSPVCPQTGSAHLRLPNGHNILASQAPNGLCQCCLPPHPLVWQEQALVCSHKPQNHYQRHQGQLILLPAGQTKSAQQATVEAIDEALRQNTAKITKNGLFDFD